MGLFQAITLYLSIVSGIFLLTGCQKASNIEDSQDVTESENVSINLSQLSDEELLASGQWKDPETGLIWMRCAIGQKWENNTCNGEALLLNGSHALKYFDLFNQEGGFAGEVSWRLPTLKETLSLRKCKDDWAQDTYRAEVLTTSGPEIQTVEGEVSVRKIPIDGELFEIPTHCNRAVVSVEKNEYGEDVKIYDSYPNPLGEEVFLNNGDNIYYTSIGYSEQNVLNPLANASQLWTFDVAGEPLLPRLTTYSYAMLAVREP